MVTQRLVAQAADKPTITLAQKEPVQQAKVLLAGRIQAAPPLLVEVAEVKPK
jgi:predicted solute-binding protein